GVGSGPKRRFADAGWARTPTASADRRGGSVVDADVSGAAFAAVAARGVALVDLAAGAGDRARGQPDRHQALGVGGATTTTVAALVGASAAIILVVVPAHAGVVVAGPTTAAVAVAVGERGAGDQGGSGCRGDYRPSQDPAECALHAYPP